MIYRHMADILLRIPPELLLAVDEEWHARKLQSRSEAIRALLFEALHRARVRRAKGQKVELGE